MVNMWLTFHCYKYVIQMYPVYVYWIWWKDHCLVLSLFFSFLYLSMYLFIFWGRWGAGIFFIFLSGGATPQKRKYHSEFYGKHCCFEPAELSQRDSFQPHKNYFLSDSFKKSSAYYMHHDHFFHFFCYVFFLDLKKTVHVT